MTGAGARARRRGAADGRVARTVVAFALALTVVSSLALELACGPARHRSPPSILLFVMDTARRDTVLELLGTPRGMPVLAGLASEGRLYTNAYAAAPWTLPSHVSLFTGELPSQHGVGVDRLAPAERTVLLAERLREAGYQTLGVSENVWLAPRFGMSRGFDRLEIAERGGVGAFEDVLRSVLADADPERPLFLFVNVMDAHGPYEPHEEEPFLASEAARRFARGAGSRYQHAMCRPLPPRVRRAVLDLYRGGLARADAKLGKTLSLLRERDGALRERDGADLVSVVLSDHGQHFGEHELVGHLYSLREELIRVPLVVHGAPGPTGEYDAPVELTAVYGSVLAWAGVADGHAPRLPRRADGETAAPLVSQYVDTGQGRVAEQSWLLAALGHQREPCDDRHRVFGDIQAVIDFPYKLVEFDRYGPELYDLAHDAGELHDLSDLRPALLEELRAQLPAPREASDPPPPSPEIRARTRERLQALGYLPDDEAEAPAPAPAGSERPTAPRAERAGSGGSR